MGRKRHAISDPIGDAVRTAVSRLVASGRILNRVELVTGGELAALRRLYSPPRPKGPRAWSAPRGNASPKASNAEPKPPANVMLVVGSIAEARTELARVAEERAQRPRTPRTGRRSPKPAKRRQAHRSGTRHPKPMRLMCVVEAGMRFPVGALVRWRSGEKPKVSMPKPRVCSWCLRELGPDARSDQFYCDGHCRDQARYDRRRSPDLPPLRRPGEARACPQCGEPVPERPRGAKRLYCSQKCTDRAHRARKREAAKLAATIEQLKARSRPWTDGELETLTGYAGETVKRLRAAQLGPARLALRLCEVITSALDALPLEKQRNGAALRALREARGLSVRGLADLAQIDPMSVLRVEAES